MDIKKIKNIIIPIIIFIVVIIICLMVILFDNKKLSSDTNTNFNNTNSISNNNEITSSNSVSVDKTEDIKETFTIERIINSALTSTYDIHLNRLGLDDTSIIEKYEEFFKELDTDDVVKEFHIKDAYNTKINETYSIYFAEGYLINKDLSEISNNNIEKKNIKFTVVKNKETNTCGIELYGQNYQDIFNYEDEIKNTTMVKRNVTQFDMKSQIDTYSQIIEESFSDEDISQWYYKDYTLKALYFSEEAYEQIDEEYKEKRFENKIENYREYLAENESRIKSGNLVKYSVNNYDKSTVYTLVDSKNNSYFIEVSSNPTEYKIKLDQYTVKLEDYEKNYSKMSERNKVAANVYIFIQMINTKDYKHAYELLDNTFKQNNFGSLEEFKTYVKDNFFDNNYTDTSFEIGQQSDYYTCRMEVKENAGEDVRGKKLEIIMKLKEGTDFVMSFNIDNFIN